MSDPLYDEGMEVRREVLGDEHVDGAIERTSEFTAPFQDFITRYAWAPYGVVTVSTGAREVLSRSRC